MSATDAAFAGSIPALYDRYLGPLLFAPYAADIAARAAALEPRHILETAAGTGIVTEALARALPEADIVATDLNQAMLDVAAGRVDRARRDLPAGRRPGFAVPRRELRPRPQPVRRDVLPRSRRRLSRGAPGAEAGRPLPVQRLGPDREEPGHRRRRRGGRRSVSGRRAELLPPGPVRLSRQGADRGRSARRRLHRHRGGNGGAGAAGSAPATPPSASSRARRSAPRSRRTAWTSTRRPPPPPPRSPPSTARTRRCRRSWSALAESPVHARQGMDCGR